MWSLVAAVMATDKTRLEQVASGLRSQTCHGCLAHWSWVSTPSMFHHGNTQSHLQVHESAGCSWASLAVMRPFQMPTVVLFCFLPWGCEEKLDLLWLLQLCHMSSSQVWSRKTAALLTYNFCVKAHRIEICFWSGLQLHHLHRWRGFVRELERTHGSCLMWSKHGLRRATRHRL